MLLAKNRTVFREFRELGRKNPPLAVMLRELADYVAETYKKDVIVTDVYRTAKETRRIYAGKAKRPRTSPHEVWKAVDIRDWIYSDAEKKSTIAFVNEYYDKRNRMNRLSSQSRTVLLHDVGKGTHFHIQYSGPLVYVFSHGTTITA